VTTRDFIGDLTNEMEEYGSNAFFEEFTSGRSKNHAFSVYSPTTGKR
jgi:hypothetical protein